MIPVAQAHLRVAAVSHPGLIGKSNEDRFAISAHHLSRSDPTPSLLAVVADGIGGHRAGEVAAEMAVEAISRWVAESDAAQPPQILAQALAHTSQLIFEQSQRDLAQAGMGTTAVCAWVIGERLYTCAVGDSRLYLLRKGILQRLTTDHTWVQEALDHGALFPGNAREHPNAHVIRRYLGSKQPLRADLRLRLRAGESDAQAEANQGMRLLPGDRLLLCSDGLTDLVDDAEIQAAFSAGQVSEATLNGLVALANQRGGHDNITILALEMPAHQAVQKLLHPSRRLVFSCLVGVGLGLAILLVAVFLGWRLLRDNGLIDAAATATTTEVNPAATTSGRATQPVAVTPIEATPAPAATVSEPAPRASPPLPVATYTPWPTNTLGP